MESWFLLSTSVALFWGLSGIFAKSSTSKLGVARVALLIAIVEGTLYSVAFLIWREPHHITLVEGVIALASCVIGLTGYLCYFESILEGQVAIAGTISAGYPALTVVGAVVLLSETLVVTQIIGIALIIAGVVAISYEPNPKAVNAINRRSLLFAVLAFFAYGAWSLSSKVAIDMVGPGNLFAFYVMSSLTAPLIYAYFRSVWPRKGESPSPTRSAWSLGTIALSLNVFGAFAFTYALDTGSASLVVPISSAYPIVTALCAIALLKEKINVVQAIAIVGVVAGLVTVGISL
jgi:transporter family protein